MSDKMERGMEVEEAIEFLKEYEYVSSYEKAWNVVWNYILSLEEQVKEVNKK